MKSFCVKTNNKLILEYLLEKLEKLEIADIQYSNKKFKIYFNVIIHYTGENVYLFYEVLSDILVNTVLKFYKEKMIKQIINFDYFYFDEYEKKIIIQNCTEIVESAEYEQLDGGKNYIYEALLKYIIENKAMILDGFVTFRLKEYIKYLNNIVDIAVNKYIIEKEYKEFISLLKLYVNSKMSNTRLIHLIYSNSESILLDEDKNIVPMCEEIYNARFLSDITFSSNDFALNTLLTLLPQRIEVHLLGKEDEFINTLKSIFEDRVFICKACNICKVYKVMEMPQN